MHPLFINEGGFQNLFTKYVHKAAQKSKKIIFMLEPKIVIVLVLRTTEHLEFSPIVQQLPRFFGT